MSDGETKQIDVMGTSVRVRVEGSGPPLLMMAGIACNIETWRPLVPLLAGRRLIMFDAPGAGLTPLMPKPWNPRRVASLVAELLDHLEIGRTDVLGYSFGGVVAQQYARDHPARVRRLILAGTLPGFGGVQHPARPAQALHVAATRDPDKRRAMVRRLLGGRSGREPEVLAEYERNRAEAPPTFTGYSSQMRTLVGWSSIPWLHTLRMPTLALSAQTDPMAPAANSRIFAWLMPDCRRHVIPGAGHLFLLDQPEDSAEVIKAFLDESGPGATTTTAGEQG